MLKSLFLLVVLGCSLGKHTDHILAELEEVNYKIVIKVIDFSAYALSGVIINVKNGNSNIGEKNLMTDSSGTVTLIGKFAKQHSYQIIAVASTTFNNIQASAQINGVTDQTGLIVFNGKVQFTQSDVYVKDEFQRGLIFIKTLSNSKPLPGVFIQFTAIYLDDAKLTKEVNFIATTNEKGEENVRFLLPTTGGSFTILYTASKLEYWNTQQLDRNSQNFVLWPEQKYELSVNIDLQPGQFQYLLTALIQDQNQKPLQGAKIQVTGTNLGSNQQLIENNLISGPDGKIAITYNLKATPKLHLKEVATKDQYLSQNSEFDQDFNLNIKKDQFTRDLIIKLQEASDLQISGIITDSSKIVSFVQGAEIVLTITNVIEPIKVITDAEGKFNVHVLVPSTQNLDIKATVKAKEFIDQVITPKQINIPSKQPYQLKLDVVLDRKVNEITIKDQLVDPSGKPVQNASIKIIESIPAMNDKSLYNKEIIGNSDGTFEYKFACYENQKFIATFIFKVQEFVPITYKTPQLECKNQDLIKTQITLSKSTSLLTIKGQVLDVDQKPMKGLQLSFKSDPSLTIANPNLITDANGYWQIDNLTVIPQNNYKFTIEYINDNKKLTQVSSNYIPSMDKQQTYTFPVIGYQRFVKVKLTGKITPSDGKAAVPIPLLITCDSKGRDGNPISVDTTTKEDGSYSVELETLAGSDKPLQCVVQNAPVKLSGQPGQSGSQGQTGQTGQSGQSGQSGSTNTVSSVQPIKINVEVKAPSWSSSTNIPVTYNTVDITIKGIVSDKTKAMTALENTDVILIITPQDVYVQSKHLLEQYLFYKRHNQNAQTQSKLSTKTGKDGSYSFSFKAVQAFTLKFLIQASNPLFQTENKLIEEKCLQSITLTENLELDRITMVTKLHSTLSNSDKKPIPNAIIKLTSSEPLMKDSKYYNIATNDDDKGSFFINFECYKDIEYIVSFQIDIPQYEEQKVKSSKFKCDQPQIELNPITLTLQKIEIKAILAGKVIDPHGKPVANLPLTITTEPVSETLTTKTQSDGTWTATVHKLFPITEYKANISYQDINKQNQKIEQKFQVQSDNQKVSVQDINYIDLVDAKIKGKIDLEKGSLSQPVTLNLNCQGFQDSKGPINKDFTTDKNGNVDITFQVLAKHDDKIICLIKPKDVIQDNGYKVELIPPNFEVNGFTIKSKFLATLFTINGKLIDETKIEEKLIGIQMSFNLKQQDPLTNQQIKIKSSNDGTFIFSFELLRGINYDGTITADGQPQFQIANNNIQLIGKEEKQSMTLDITLKRVIVDCTISGSLIDSKNKAVENAKVEILSSIPQMQNAQFYNKFSQANKGEFSIPFQCYNQVFTTLKLDMVSDAFPKSPLAPQVFTCGEKDVKLKPIQIITKTAQITFSGVLTDKSGITMNVQGADIEVVLNPSDPLASNLKTKSDQNGKYSLTFNAVFDQSYQAVIQITHSDFTPFKSPSIAISTNKDQTVTQDAALDRIILKATVSSTLTDPQGKPSPVSTLTVESLQPVVKGTEKNKITGKTDANGKFNLDIPCYKNTEGSFILDVSADKYIDTKTDKISFQCNGPQIQVPPIKVKQELTPVNTKLTVGGEIIDPKGKGKPGISIKLISDPVTKEYEAKTGSDGKWQLLDDQLQFGVKYQLTEQFSDVTGQIHKITLPFQTNDEKSQLIFPKQFYDDYLPFQVDGELTSEGGIAPSNIPVSMQCDGFGQDNRPIDIRTNTDNAGKYQIKWDMLMNSNSKVQCLVITQETAKFKQTSHKFYITPDSGTVKISTQAEVTPGFKGQLNKYYQYSSISGVVMAEFDCDGGLVWRGLEGVNIKLKQWNGIAYNDLKTETKSDKNGLFVIKYQVLKSQIQNEMSLEFNKDNYYPASADFNIYSFDPQPDGTYQVLLSNIKMVKIGVADQCPQKKRNH
ncbi:unnamed protein product [Paramecium octaurelia]|uniref:Uncharacterized protein n=1 Tax=Paramecium octaurelia TaxID=43137 RepID=A0A8S1XMK4_PAROT|nr:unnamed protein product [Paramecium octaurelia]